MRSWFSPRDLKAGSFGGMLRNGSDEDGCFGTESFDHSNVVLALVIINNIGILVSILLLLSTFGYLVFVKKLQTTFHFYESQICLTMCLSECFNFLGFWMSPCQPLSIQDEPFTVFCISCSAIQLFMDISTFTWIFLLVLHICHLVAKACQKVKLDAKPEEKTTKRRLTLEENALEENVATHSKLEHKMSKDLLELWKKNNKKRFNQEQGNPKLENQDSKERRLDETQWYIKAFGDFQFPMYVSLILGYVPALVLTLVSCLTRPNIEIPSDGINLQQPWEGIKGLDIYCWPGTETQMLYYMLAVVLSLFVAILYFRVKAIQMVRIFQGGPLDALNSISNWQLQNSGRDGSQKVPLFHLDTTSIELRVVFCTWMIGILQTFYIWGLMLPFTTLNILKCAIFFLYHVLYDIKCCKSRSEGHEPTEEEA